MATLRTIVIFILVLSFLTFVAFFGRLPSLRNTPIGALHRVLWIHIPKLFSHLDQAVSGGRVGLFFSRTGHYLMHEKHPIVTIIFLGLITVCAVLILPHVWIPSSGWHKLLVVLLLPQPYLFTYLAASTRMNPELHINPENLQQQLSYYPYDYCLYHPGIDCRTCNTPKPARSKHCSICKACVARADHHCIWVNNCLGRGNYRWFLLLLISTAALLFLGAHLSYTHLSPLVSPWFRSTGPSRRVAGDPAWVWLVHPISNRVSRALEWLQIALSVGGLSITGVGMLAAFTTPLPLGLLAYHLYLIWAGTTTNESGKWMDWRDDMLDGVAWIGNLKISERDAEAEHYQRSHLHSSCKISSQACDWPTRSRFCMVTTTDGQAPRPPLPRGIEMTVDMGTWRRVWRLAQVENIYDLGFSDNFWEALR